MSEKIKIIIADDHDLFIDGLKMLLSNQEGFDVIDIAKNGRELLDLIPITVPDIILLDISMPQINGLDVLRFLKNSFPYIKVIILSTYSEFHLIEKSKELGAYSYLLKNSSIEILREVIRATYAGKKMFPAEDKSRNNHKEFNLTKREFQLLDLIKNGKTNMQIAAELFLSVYTVETHRKNIMQKLKLKTPAELMKFIISNNI